MLTDKTNTLMLLRLETYIRKDILALVTCNPVAARRFMWAQIGMGVFGTLSFGYLYFRHQCYEYYEQCCPKYFTCLRRDYRRMFLFLFYKNISFVMIKRLLRPFGFSVIDSLPTRISGVIFFQKIL